MKDEERYETLINGKKYKFYLKFDGFVWIGWAFNDSVFGVMYSACANDSEKAALNLVKVIENDKRLIL